MPFLAGRIAALPGLGPETVAEADDIAPLLMLLQRDDAVMLLVELQRSRREMTACCVELRIDSNDASERITLELKASPLQDEQHPDAVEWHGFMHDITERKRAEEALRSSEREYRLLADELPTPIIRYEADGRFRYLNRSAEAVMGLKAADLTGRPLGASGLLSPELLASYRAAIHEVATTGKARDFDMAPDGMSSGRLEHYAVRLVPDPAGDDRAGVLAVGFDISARKRAEQALQEREYFLISLLDTIPLPVFYKDREGRYRGLNKAFLAYFGGTREQLIGKTLLDIQPREIAELYQVKDRELFEQGGIQHYESRVIDKQGQVRELVTSRAVYTDKNGIPAGLIGVLQDITDIRATERRLANFIDNLPGMAYTFRLTPEGQASFPFVSPVIREIYGLEPEDVKDDFMPIHLRAHPEDRPRIDAAIKESMQTMTPFRMEARVCRPGHPERWFETRSIPEREADGSILWTGLMLDITDRKQVEQKQQAQFEEIVELNTRLEESARELEEYAVEIEAAQEQLKVTEAWYRGILHSAPDGMMVVSERGVITLVNSELARMFGYAENELVGLPMEVLVPADLRQEHGDMRAGFTKGMVHGRSNRLGGNLRARRKDGSEFAVDVALSRLPDTDGNLKTICAAVRDITQRKLMEEQLRRREQYLRTLLDNFPFFVWLKDEQGRLLAANTEYARVARVSSTAELEGRTEFDFFPRDLAEQYFADDLEVIAARKPKQIEELYTDEHGERHWMEVWKSPLIVDDRVVGTVGFSRDITERKRTADALALREREFRTLVENSTDSVARYGRDFRRLYVNPAFAAHVEGGEAALIGTPPSEVPGGPNAAIFEQHLAKVFESGQELEFELKAPDKDGRELCNLVRLTPEFGEDGTVESILAVGRDITELHAVRQKIHQMAFYDPLTGLPNRALFNDRLRQMIADASWHGQLAGVIMIDMDRFKAVNDSMGHAVGDELLRETAARLAACVRSYDTVARLGGDEFAILLPQVRAGSDLGRVASKILGAFDERFLLDGKEVFVSCSIGIALYPNDSIEPGDLVKYADSAMYFAKRSGRNNFRFYSKDLTATARERLTLESELRRAVERNELELYYQPKVLLQNSMIVGSEALLRWRHPQRGMVPPDQFIAIAEDTGMIIELGKWVLREACRTASEWNEEGKLLHRVAINLSARQFHSSDLAMTMARILDETACRPEWIELEITESLLLDEDGKTLEILSKLRAMGITIAIDDFGTGYSALSYLARFPIDTLKIDKSFIQSVATDSYRAELVKAILSIARCLKQEVVAEGVETVEQAVFLEAHGCRFAQGFLYSRPLPKAEFAAFERHFS